MRILALVLLSAGLAWPQLPPELPRREGRPRAQDRRYMFNNLTVSPYPIEMYFPQITNGPNFPTWSPDGKQVAFAMRGSIWRLTLGDSTAYELTQGPGYDSQPAWSPDGNWIAYTSERNEQIHLKVLNLQSGAVQALTSANSINLEPEWSPDGSRLAYVSTHPKGRFHIWAMPLSNGVPGTPQQITSDVKFPNRTVYYGEWAHHLHPTWTPDGKELILVSNRDSQHGTGGFYRMAATPGAPMERFHYEETTWQARPTLSPDGSKLVYASYLGRQWHQLWAMPPKGGDGFPLTYGDFDRTTPRWSPDGTRIAFISNQTGDTSLWLFHYFGGRLEPVKIGKYVYKRPMGTLRVRVLDKATGQPMAARVHLKAADGRSYAAPQSWFHTDWHYYPQLETEEYSYFHTGGVFEMELPVGPVKLFVSRGFEYLPQEQEVTLDASKPASLSVALERLEKVPAKDKGWWDGDNHFHMNYAGAYFNTPQRLMKVAEAEDLSVLNNLICNKEQRIPDISHFQGKPDPVSTARRVLYHSQEYHPPFWGHAVFLNIKDHVIIPEYVGYPNTIVESLYPPNTVPFRVARAQGALTGYAHGAGANFPVDMALETVDFVEANSAEAMEPLYKAWNLGYRVVASGGADAMPNFFRGHTIGAVRVYVKTGPKLDNDKWHADFRDGRSFVSAGPLVYFKLNGREPGDEIRLEAGKRALEASVEVASIAPIEKIELLHNGEVIETLEPSGKPLRAHLKKTVSVEKSGWFAARVIAQAARQPLRRGQPFAATMPVWVIVDGQPVRSKKDADYFIELLDDALTQALAVGKWNNEQEKDEVRKMYAEARARLAAR
jgi:Tol biopolymer transport system component